MTRIIKTWFFPAFLLFVIMAEGIFSAYMVFTNASDVSGKLQYVFIGIFAISMLLLFRDIKRKANGYKFRRLLIVLVIIVFLYITSSLFVNAVPSDYITYLLVLGSKCVPACIIGMHLARYSDVTLRKVDRLIPFFVIPVGLIVGLVGFRAALMSEIVRAGSEDSGGLNYQSLSYYMAEFYAYSAYYLFFSTARRTKLFIITKWIMLVAMFFFAVNCVMGGGRGAMVYMVFSSVFIFYHMIQSKRIKKSHAILAILGLVVCFGMIASKLGVFESAGFERIADNMTSDDNRKNLHQQALDSFWSSPLFGHGLGSVWWEVGYYSHNMIFDILVETGIFGLIIVFCVGLKMFKRMLILCKYNSGYLFLMLMFIKAAITGMFSGYYLGLYCLWLVIGLIFVRPSSFYRLISCKRYFR